MFKRANFRFQGLIKRLESRRIAIKPLTYTKVRTIFDLTFLFMKLFRSLPMKYSWLVITYCDYQFILLVIRNFQLKIIYHRTI